MDIIISHIFRMDLTKQCLDSIPDSHTVHLIDNSVVMEAKSYADRRGFINSIRPDNPPLSYAASLNRGIKESKAKWYILANNDILFSPQSFKQFEELAKNPQGADLFITPAGSWSCVMLSAKAYKKVGKFDERFTPCAGEDDDYMIRFCKLGFKWVGIPVAVWHLEGGHCSRIDGGRNVAVFEEKWNFKYGSSQHKEIIELGRWNPTKKIWTPS